MNGGVGKGIHDHHFSGKDCVACALLPVFTRLSAPIKGVHVEVDGLIPVVTLQAPFNPFPEAFGTSTKVPLT